MCLVAVRVIETYALLVWVYCAVTPFGRWQDASDQAEVLRYCGIPPGLVMLIVIAMTTLIWTVSWPVARRQMATRILPL